MESRFPIKLLICNVMLDDSGIVFLKSVIKLLNLIPNQTVLYTGSKIS